MDKDFILKEYAEIGVSSQSGLFSFVLEHDHVTVGSKTYNLNNSNESLEFMVNYLRALDFEVFRLFLEKNDEEDNKHHWFLIFSNGIKWFYYETNIKEIADQYVFKNYNSLATFAFSKIVRALDGTEDKNVYEKYTLKEISKLPNLSIEDDLRISRAGSELLVWNSSNKNVDYDKIIKKVEKEEIKSRNRDNDGDRKNVLFFIIGFILTLILGVFLIWLLASFYANR